MSEAERYDITQYERPSVTVDVVTFSVVEGELKVLLIRRRNWPFEGMWAIPGGIVEIDEPLKGAAARGSYEETGVSCTVSKKTPWPSSKGSGCFRNNDNLRRHSAAHRFSIWARRWMPNCAAIVALCSIS
jgi:8-oxo-dGTP pyrophosphatase MutT (NUDIX family)